MRPSNRPAESARIYLKCRYRVVRPTPMRCIPFSRIRCACASFVDVIFGGRPPVRARAAARPTWVRSRIRSRSNSASAPKIGEDEFPSGGGDVDRFGQRFEADSAGGEIFDGLQQLGQ